MVRLDADVGADQRLLELVPGLGVDAAPGADRGEVARERRAGLAQPVAEPGPDRAPRPAGHGLVDGGGQFLVDLGDFRLRPRASSSATWRATSSLTSGRHARGAGRRARGGWRRGGCGCAPGRTSVPTRTPSTATRMKTTMIDMRARAYSAAPPGRLSGRAPDGSDRTLAGRGCGRWEGWSRVGLGGLLREEDRPEATSTGRVGLPEDRWPGSGSVAGVAAEGHVDRDGLAVALHLEGDRCRRGCSVPTLPRNSSAVVIGGAVDRGDDVADLEAGLLGRAARLDLGDEGAGWPRWGRP